MTCYIPAKMIEGKSKKFSVKPIGDLKMVKNAADIIAENFILYEKWWCPVCQCDHYLSYCSKERKSREYFDGYLIYFKTMEG